MKNFYSSVLCFSMFCFSLNFSAKNPINLSEKSNLPGNKLFLSIPADGLPNTVTICNAINYKVNVANLESTPQTNVTLEVKFPIGIVPLSTGVTVNNVLASFSTPNVNLPNEIIVNIGTIAGNRGNAQVIIAAQATCAYYSFAKAGGNSRIFYKANYSGNSDFLNIIGNDLGYTIEFNNSLPALNILSVTPSSPNVSLTSIVTKTIEIINGGNGGLSTFDVFDTHGSAYQVSGVSGAAVLSNSLNQLKLRVNSTQIQANAVNSNGDGILDLNEKYFVSITYTVTRCEPSQTFSEIKVAWGCEENVYCDNSVSNGGMTFGSIIPSLSIVELPISQSPVCFGQNFKKVLRITNNGTGDSNFGTLKISCTGQSNNTEYNNTLLLNRFVPNSVKIRVNNGPLINATVLAVIPPSSYDASYDAKYVSCFGSLASSINAYEISLPNLKPNEFITVEYDIATCSNETSCAGNDFSGQQAYRIKYTDACQIFNLIAVGHVGTMQFQPDLGIVVDGPSDLNGGVGFEENGIYNYTVTNYANNYNANVGAKFHLEFTIEPGLIINTNTLLATNFNLNGNAPLAGFPTFVGNKIVVEYAYPFATSPVGGIIKINLTASCPVPATTSAIANVSISGYFIASATCASNTKNRIGGLCSSAPFPTVVRCGGPCPDGLQGTKAEAFRTTIGLTDANNDNIADSNIVATTGINIKRVALGDHFTVRTESIVNNETASIIFNQMGGTFTFPVPANVNTGIQAVSANVQVIRNGVSYLATALPVTQVGGVVNFYYSATLLGLPGGIFANDDLVNVDVKIINNENSGGFQILNRTVQTYMFIATAPQGLQYSCDNFSANYQAVGFLETASSQANATLITGCSNVFFVQQLTGKRFGTNWNTDPFPNEFRAAYLPNQTVFKIPNGYILDVASSYTQYSTIQNGIGVTINAPLQAANYTATSTQITVDLFKDFAVNGGTIATPDMQILADTYLYFKPSCTVTTDIVQNFGTRTSYSSLSPTTQANANIRGMRGVDLKDYGPYPVAVNPPGVWFSNSGVTYSAADLNLSTGAAIQDVDNKFISWSVNITNPTTSATANSWFSIGSLSSPDLSVFAVTEGNNSFPLNVTNGLYELGSLAPGQIRTITIRAQFAQCGESSLTITAGWNCAGYPSSVGTFPCPTKQLILKSVPLPGEIQTSIISQPSFPVNFCEKYTFKNRVINTKNSYLWDHKNTIGLTSGFGLVAGSVVIEFPEGSGNVTTVSSTHITVLNNVYTINVSAAVADLDRAGNGLRPVSDIVFNKYTITYQIETFCPAEPDFITIGRQIHFQANAKTWCGANTNDPLLVSNPYSLVGAPLPYNINSTITNSTFNVCAPNENEVTIKLINIGSPPFGPNNSTSSNGFITVILPDDLSYISNSVVSVSNFATINPTITVNSNGQNVLNWPMTNGVGLFNEIQFKIKVAGNSNSTCGNENITVETSSLVNLFCSTSNSFCPVRNLTSQLTKQILLDKPDFELSAMQSSYFNGIHRVNYVVSNVGQLNQISLNPLIVNFYCSDTSCNPTGAILATQTLSNVLAAGSSANIAFEFAGTNCGSGRLIAVIDPASNCSCELTRTQCSTLVNFIVANPDSYGTYTVQNGGITGSVLLNDTLNGVPVNLSTVSLTPGIAPAGTSIIMNTDGTITIPSNTPAGVYTYPYTICQSGVGVSNCSATVATITVVPVIIAVIDTIVNVAPGANTQISVLNNDILNGAQASSSTVTLQVVTGATTIVVGAAVPVLNIVSGLVEVPNNTPGGIYVITYIICDRLNTAFCSTTTVSVCVNPLPVIGLINNPTCASSLGNFTITNYSSANTYTILPVGNNAVIDNAGLVTLSSGSYIVQVTYASGCFAQTQTVEIAAQPLTPATPSISAISQPNCTSSVGTFTITNYNPLYTYNFSPAGAVISNTGVVTASVGTYSLSAILGTCQSATLTGIVVNIQPSTPAVPILSAINQPSCSNLSGTFSIVNYNNMNSYVFVPSGPQISSSGSVSATTGNYTIVSTNAAGCSSVTLSFNILSTPIVTAIPLIDIQQPSCATLTGKITVTSVTSGLTYTLTGTNPVISPTSSTTGIFSDLQPGNYDLVAVSTGTCPSTPLSIIIAAVLPIPNSASITIQQATCATPSGSISVVNPAPNVGTIYTLTGVNPVMNAISNANGNFSGLAGGNYELIVKNAVGCSSVPTTFTINAVLTVTPTPIINAILHPTCSFASGTFTISNYSTTSTYSITPNTGINIGNTGIVSALSGLYSITVNNGSCTSTPVTVTINLQPLTPLQPSVLLVLDEQCAQVPIQTLTASAQANSATTIVWYDAPIGGQVVSAPILNTIGTREYFAQSEIGNCISSSRTAVTLRINKCEDPCKIEFFSAISPENNDNINDYFHVKGIECYPNNTVEIYNRWGVLVFQSAAYDNKNNVFVGESNGRTNVFRKEKLPAGTYYYVVKISATSTTEDIVKNGYLYINR